MCDLPEEVWDGREIDIIYAELVPGSIVWAKQLGYPWWPGMVEHDPQTGKYFMFTTDSDQFPSKYHITFFDTTVSHAWIPVPLIKGFREIPQERNVAKRDFSKRVNTAKKMAEEAQKVKIQDRISQFGFLVRYKGIEDAKLSEDSASQESLEDPCIVEDAKRPKPRNKEEFWSKDCAEKETETHQLRARKGKEKNGDVHLAAGPKKPGKQKSPAHLVRKMLPNNSKWFRDPTLKRDSSGGNQEVAEKSAASNGIEEVEPMPQRAKGTEDKVTGHGRVQHKACFSPDPDSHTLPRIAAEKESMMAKKHLLWEHPSPPRDGLASEGFTKLLQEVVEKKQDADSFSDNDMAVLTLKKSEDEEEFADFMFEE
ncbi:zinc finger CW-type PWWP domain protein 1-like [Stegostoma tigrinum]|uniref:zinc finger CW-type PWWP domain protein 1-like n=1 Tax=Stegostoma tigrinum TaxID=3053191 RepID=UPI002870761F|nr:zinc finger CW-type PWWP domain protein 1-like [Stegostoma tigrinum]